MTKIKNIIEPFFLKGFFLFWAFWIILDYSVNHPYYLKAIVDNPYGNLLLGFGLFFGGGLSFLEYRRIKKPGRTLHLKYNGLSLLVLIIITSILILWQYLLKTPELANQGISNQLSYFSFYLIALLAGISFIFLCAYGFGKTLLDKMPLRYGAELPILSIALGFSLFGFLLFILGAFGLLQTVYVWVLTGLVFALGARQNWAFFYETLLKIKTVQLERVWPLAVLSVVLLVSAVHLIASVKAYPIGFDGTNLYINQANLIADTGSIPLGSHAFNWGLIMSLGMLLFKETALTIMLSSLMGVACFFAIYFFSKKWLKWPFALLAATVPFVSQYFGFHIMMDEKTDLAFLFLGISAVLFLFPKRLKPNPKSPWAFLNKFEASFISWALAGWIAGFAFGVKYTGLFLIIALGVFAFYRKRKTAPTLAYFLIALGGVFLFKVYQFGFLPILRSESVLLGSIFLIAGILISFGPFLKTKFKGLSQSVPPFRESVSQYGLLLITALLCFAPWGIQNIRYSEDISLASFVVQDSNKLLLADEGSGGMTRVDSLKRLFPRQWEQVLEQEQNPTQIGSGLKLLDSLAKADGLDFDSLYQIRKAEIEDARIARSTTERPDQEEIGLDETEAVAMVSEGVYEELKRYLGYEKGLWLYTSVPYDLTTNNNFIRINARYLDIGFLLLVLLPLLLISTPGTKFSWPKNLLLIFTLLVWVASSYYAAYSIQGTPSGAEILSIRQGEFNLLPGGADSFLWLIYAFFLSGFLWIMELFLPVFEAGSKLSIFWVLLLLTVLYILGCYLYKPRLKQYKPSFESVNHFLLVYFYCWLLLGNGIVWYGIIVWALIPVLIMFFMENPDKFLGDSNRIFSKGFLSGLIGLFLLGSTITYFYGPHIDRKNSELFHWQMVGFATSPTIKKAAVINGYNPYFTEALKYLNQNTSEKIYGVNSYLRFHIKENDRRIINDNMLVDFNSSVPESGDYSAFIALLKRNEVEYILYDFNTEFVDQTPEKSLKRKTDQFLDMLTTSPELEVLVTDRFVYDEGSEQYINHENGQRYPGRFALDGQVIYFGSFVLCRLR